MWPINANEPDIYSRLSLSFFSPFLALIFYLFVCVFCFFLFSGCKLIFFIDFYGDFLGCLCGPDGMRLGLLGDGDGIGSGADLTRLLGRRVVFARSSLWSRAFSQRDK